MYTKDWTGTRGRLHHVAFATDTREDILHAADVFLDAGIHIETGPHKHAIQQTFFLYVWEPGGNRIELCNAGARLLLAPDHQVVTWTEAERRRARPGASRRSRPSTPTARRRFPRARGSPRPVPWVLQAALRPTEAGRAPWRVRSCGTRPVTAARPTSVDSVDRGAGVRGPERGRPGIRRKRSAGGGSRLPGNPRNLDYTPLPRPVVYPILAVLPAIQTVVLEPLRPYG